MNKRQRKKRLKHLLKWRDIIGQATYPLWQSTAPLESAPITFEKVQEAYNALMDQIKANQEAFSKANTIVPERQ